MTTKLKSVTRALGYSGRDLADMTGLSRSSVYKYLSGARPLSLKTARAVFAPALMVPAEELMGFTEEASR